MREKSSGLKSNFDTFKIFRMLLFSIDFICEMSKLHSFHQNKGLNSMFYIRGSKGYRDYFLNLLIYYGFGLDMKEKFYPNSFSI